MSWATIKSELLGPARDWRWPIYYTAFLYIIFTWIIWLICGRSFAGFRIVFDFALDLGIATLVFWVSRRVWPFVLFMTLYFAILYGASAFKIVVLGQPILPEEIHNLKALILILGPLGWIGVALPLAIFAALFFGNLKLSGLRAKGAAGFMLLASAGVTQASMPVVLAIDNVVGNASWNQSQNFYERGGALNFLQETMRLFASEAPAPGAEEVAEAYRRLQAASAGGEITPATLPAGRQRNVHVLLLESFWHPTPLVAAKFNQDPFDPRFVDLWRQTGYTEALSPAFGGQTANAEYEVLCGFPVNKVAVEFEYGIKRAAPCLPELLRRAGFHTVASHPNRGIFWNRTEVYRLIGFDKFWSAEYLDGSKSKDRLMADAELFRQVKEKLAAEGDHRPLFDYMVTIDGHWDYMPPNGRPIMVTTKSKVEDVGRYADMMYYKSRDVVDVIAALRRDDPDSLIIAFGDHLPILGNSFAGYVESGLLPETFGEFTKANYDFSSRTPLVVIDGRNGPLNLGTLPMYDLPSLIMRLLNLSGPTIFDLARPPAGVMPRPLPEANVAYRNGKIEEACRTPDQSPVCARMAAWLKDVKIVDQDLFGGEQHVLKLMGLQPGPPQASN